MDQNYGKRKANTSDRECRYCSKEIQREILSILMTSAVISDADQGFVLIGNLIANLRCLFQVGDIESSFLHQGCVTGKLNSFSLLWYLFSSALHTLSKAKCYPPLHLRAKWSSGICSTELRQCFHPLTKPCSSLREDKTPGQQDCKLPAWSEGLFYFVSYKSDQITLTGDPCKVHSQQFHHRSIPEF